MSQNEWFVYILRCSDNTLYTGVTTDCTRRLHEHNHLRSGARYTRARRPVTLVYQEPLPCRSSAQRREAQIKRLSVTQKERLIRGQGRRGHGQGGLTCTPIRSTIGPHPKTTMTLVRKMSEQFTPTNEIEKRLLAAQRGEISGEEFMAELLRSELFMPILEQPAAVSNLQTSHTAHPLTLEDEEGNQVVVLFTSPERGKTFLLEHPGYQGGLLAEFTWILEKLGSGLGLTINPGWETGFEMSPEMLQQLANQA